MANNFGSLGEESRYDRQERLILLGRRWDQRKLMSAKVLIGGAGALGCELAKNLALLGVGHIKIVDFDVVELSNLNRQMLFRDEDIGKNKALVAAERLKELNPRVEVEAYPVKIEDIPINSLKGITLIASTFDNFQARHYTNSLAFTLGVPMIDGGTFGFFGHVRIIIPFKTPCYECYPPQYSVEKFCTLKRIKVEDVYDALSKYIDISFEVAKKLYEHNYKLIEDILYEKPSILMKLGLTRKQIETLHKKAKPKMPALITTNAIIAGIMAQEIVKVLHGIKPWINFYSYDGLNTGLKGIHLRRKRDCWFCGKYGIARG